MAEEYLHLEPDDMIESIAGHYTMEKEFFVEQGGRKVLVVLGHTIIDRACCGMGGCRYAFVPGFLAGGETLHRVDGKRITPVEPVDDERDREAIAEKINALEVVQQVVFS